MAVLYGVGAGMRVKMRAVMRAVMRAESTGYRELSAPSAFSGARKPN